MFDYRKMSIITYILIFVYLKANGYFKKTCSVTNACTLVKVLIFQAVFRHEFEADLKQLMAKLYVTFDT